MTPFAEFYETIRVLLGDVDAYGVFQFSDATLDSALKSVVRLGRGPAGYALAGGGAGIEPTVPDGTVFATFVYDAALTLVGGGDDTTAYRTRALSVTNSGDRRAFLLAELRHRLYEIRDGGDGFATQQDFHAWMHGTLDRLQLVEMKVPGPVGSVTLAADAAGLS